MAKSRAKKRRDKLAREGLRNPETGRGSRNVIRPISKMTPTKKEQLLKIHSKHKKRNRASFPGDYDSVFLFGKHENRLICLTLPWRCDNN
ncbi:hypothetical protein JOC77_001555 [Peribacillus deserti]|uniref:Uncharacterized protein n=1 Tax=Peribacillus deserti TaxID=673318 RepID=A0ABS2QG49_9BACI|nr:hypothetical protein [Peribacillus deserti]MBM7692128.1 hypothetical protein [Peribacillus deserti]